jgi:hypothetical protein
MVTPQERAMTATVVGISDVTMRRLQLRRPPELQDSEDARIGKVAVLYKVYGRFIEFR